MRKLLDQARVAYQTSIKLAARSEGPSATHVPILVSVAAAFKSKFLIEFGLETFSTFSFLDEVGFPSLQRIESYENNGSRPSALAFGPPPHQFSVRKRRDAQGCRGGDTPDGADMVFIDGSLTAEHRFLPLRKWLGGVAQGYW
jgi:hypothetical protein